MSRQKGHRDRPQLYAKILTLLKQTPDGLTAYAIAQRLRANHCTIRRTYLPDLVEQGKVTATREVSVVQDEDGHIEKRPIEKGRVLYTVVTGDDKV